MKNAPRDEVRAVYAALAARLLDSSLRQQVDSVFPLGNFAAALARLEAEDRRGKILFRMDPPKP
jgi:NADPH:quinone reductase-like Zn-dependent oxidoreductase